MGTQVRMAPGVNTAPTLSGGALKIFRDTSSVLEMKLVLMQRGWYWYLLSSLVFPVAIFYWSRGLAPDDPDPVLRVMVGAMVFGVSMGTMGTLAQQLIQDRFQGRLKLLITMPMVEGCLCHRRAGLRRYAGHRHSCGASGLRLGRGSGLYGVLGFLPHSGGRLAQHGRSAPLDRQLRSFGPRLEGS